MPREPISIEVAGLAPVQLDYGTHHDRLIGAGIGYGCGIPLRYKGGPESRRPAQGIIVQPDPDSAAMSSAVGHFGQNLEGEDIAGNVLSIDDAAERNCHFLRLAWVPGHALDVFSLSKSDHGCIVLPEFSTQVEIGPLIIAILQAEPDMQILQCR